MTPTLKSTPDSTKQAIITLNLAAAAMMEELIDQAVSRLPEDPSQRYLQLETMQAQVMDAATLFGAACVLSRAPRNLAL